MSNLPYADQEYYETKPFPAGKAGRDMPLAERVSALENSSAAGLAALQAQIDANDAIDVAQQAADDANAAADAIRQAQINANDAVDAAQQSQADAADALSAAQEARLDADDIADAAQDALIANKEDTGVAAALDVALKAQADANDALDAAQQAQSDAADALNVAQQAQIDANDAADVSQQTQIDAAAVLDAAQQASIDANTTLAAAQQVQIDQNATDIADLTTDDVSEGSNLYFTEMRVLATVLAGYAAGAGTVGATDTLLEALQKLDGNIQSVDLTALIDDVVIVNNQVWSSQQTDKAITDAFSAFVSGSPALLDTWIEVVAEIQDNDSDIATAITDIAHNTAQADQNTIIGAANTAKIATAEIAINSINADIVILLQRIADNAAAIAALKTSAWENSDGSIADQSSTDIEFNAGTVKLGDYADGNNEITDPTGLYSRESDGTMKIITIEDLASLMGLTPPVVIEGFVITGQTLSISDYGGVGGPTDGHQWYADGLPIVGASGATYTITTVDEGSKITVKVNGEESNELSNFYPAYINPEIWFDPSQSLAGELVNAGTGDIATLNSGAEQPLAIYNGMPVNHMRGQTYTLPDQFNGAAESLTFVTTWLENVRVNNSVFRLSQEGGADRSQMHIPWSNGIVYFDIQGMDDRFATNIGDAGQVLLASYQNNPTDATATIYRSGDPNPTSPYSITIPFNSASPTATGAIFGEGATDHYMLDTIISSAELSTTAKEKLEGYVAWKYNMPEILPPAHAYKLAPA